MATRSSSNKGTDRRALNVPPPARNTQDNTQAVRRMPDVSYGEQQALTEQQKIYLRDTVKRYYQGETTWRK